MKLVTEVTSIHSCSDFNMEVTLKSRTKHHALVGSNWEVDVPVLGLETDYSEFFFISLSLSRQCWHRTLEEATTTHSYIPYNSLFTIILPCDMYMLQKLLKSLYNDKLIKICGIYLLM